MSGKIVGAAVGGAALLLLGFVVVIGGGTVANADAPTGGCAVQVPVRGGQGDGGPRGPQKDATLNANHLAVARTIVGVGKGMGITKRGTAIALGTAMQESTLNPEATDGYGTGIFQQQGEYYANVNKKDPAAASRAFYEMLLKRVPHYEKADVRNGGISFADAAQTVQASGAGASWYARWENWALALNNQLFDGTPAPGDGGHRGVTCKVGGGSGPITIVVKGLSVELPGQAGVAGTFTFPNDTAATAAVAALSYLGTPYAWGGGTTNGPSKGIRDGGVADAHGDYTTTGFDCSGLMLYAYAQAGINLPRVSQMQQKFGHSMTWDKAQPGDMLFWGHPAHHVAMYLGKIGETHYMVEAPQSGDVVKVSHVRTGGDFAGAAVRPY